MAEPIKFDEWKEAEASDAASSPACVLCEQMLADALDGVLAEEEQMRFDRHIGSCVRCSERLAEAQRGAAWLSLLKAPRPEPSAALLERILAQTSGAAQANTEFATPTGFATDAGFATGAGFATAGAVSLLPVGDRTPRPKVLAFPARLLPLRSFSRGFEPRLALTAAMAFFSIALTLNLTGVRLDQLHARDLKPSSLKRNYFEANAHAVRFVDNLRVVRVLESRVDTVRLANGSEQRTGSEEIHQDKSPAAPALTPKSGADSRPGKPGRNGGLSLRETPAPGLPVPLGKMQGLFQTADLRTSRQALQGGGLS